MAKAPHISHARFADDALSSSRSFVRPELPVKKLPKNDEMAFAVAGGAKVDVSSLDASSGLQKMMNGAGALAGVAGMSEIAVPMLGGGFNLASRAADKVGAGPVARGAKAASDGITRFSGKTFGEVFGGNAVTTRIGGMLEKIFGVAGDAVGNVARITHYDRWQADRYTQKAGKQFAKAVELGKKASEHDLPQEAKALLNHFSANGIEHVDAQKFASAKEAMEAATKKAKLPRAAKKALSKFEGMASHAVSNHASAADVKDIGAAFKKVPSAIASHGVLRGVANTAFFGFSVKEATDGLFEFSHDMKAARQLKAELKGASPELVAHDRAEAAKKLTISLTTAITSTIPVIRNAIGHNVNPLLWFLPNLLGGALGALLSKPQVGRIYIALNRAHAAGAELSADDYERLLEVASDKLAHRPEAFRQELAKQYAAEKLAPAAVLEELHNGAMEKRVQGVIAANRALKPAKHEEPAISHVNRLQQRGGLAAKPASHAEALAARAAQEKNEHSFGA